MQSDWWCDCAPLGAGFKTHGVLDEMRRYPVPAALRRVEETIQRSRFITTATTAASNSAARGFIQGIRTEFHAATHHCFAFVIGPPGSTAQIGMGDDGEPPGTAGRPMLAVLLGSGIGDIAVVVSRYFGGTKLGTGGLVRAYSGCAKSILAALKLVDKVELISLIAKGPYSWTTALLRTLPQYEARLAGQSFGSDVTWEIHVPEDRASGLRSTLVELSSGEIKVAVL